jgi:hypothetical protein
LGVFDPCHAQTDCACAAVANSIVATTIIVIVLSMLSV